MTPAVWTEQKKQTERQTDEKAERGGHSHCSNRLLIWPVFSPVARD